LLCGGPGAGVFLVQTLKLKIFQKVVCVYFQLSRLEFS